jgi:ATP-binding cassette subfamily F protein 3
MIQLSGVAKTFGQETLFEDITLQIRDHSRLGLVGRNGCGKSTLLKLIMGYLQPESGTIARTPGLRVNYLSQEPQLQPGLTLREEMRSVYAVLDELHAEEALLIKHLETAEGQAQMDALSQLVTVQERIHLYDPDTLDARISRLLQDLGFALADFDRKTADFSGGWRMRINLAKVLLEGADVLLLDEPTNHLDLESCEWLEGFLKTYPGGIVLVSHDRRFLDEVTTEIAELELGKITVWTGNYSAYLQQKAEHLERTLSAYERQQKEIAKQTAFVERFRASANRSTQAKSREKQLAKIERIEVPDTDETRMKVRFPAPQASGREVLALQNVAKSFGDKHLFRNLEADMERNQRIFLLGANGCGKTTLLRLILGTEKPDKGQIKAGHNVNLGYFSQNQLETLDPKLSLFDTLHNVSPKLTNSEVRGLLARFLFTGDEVFKPVQVLSGGEKSKVALAKLMLSGPNTLLLDEPTNHMDIPAKEVLTEAFREFEGSILCISHDRYFIQELATHIWEIYEGQLIQYAGDYEYYLYKRKELRAKALEAAAAGNGKSKGAQPDPVPLPSAGVKPVVSGGRSPLQQKRDLEKQVTKLEKRVIALETEIGELETRMAEPAIQQDYQKLTDLSQLLEAKRHALESANTEWESLSDQLAAYPTD